MMFAFQVCGHRGWEKPTAGEEDDQGLDKEDVSSGVIGRRLLDRWGDDHVEGDDEDEDEDDQGLDEENVSFGILRW